MAYPLSSSGELEDIKADYATSLLDLTFNSKPIINMLTTIAQENLHAAEPIVSAIEDRIAFAPPNQKLPSIYLLDSISKNIGIPFTPLFARNLYKTFMDCYTAVDPNTRHKLGDLFNTWKMPVTGSHSQTPVFPLEDTRRIEEALQRMRLVQERSSYNSPAPYGAPWQQHPPPPSRFDIPPRPPIVDQLLHDIEGLLLTLDTRIRVNPQDYQSLDLIGKLRQLYDILRTTALRPQQLDEIRDQLRGITSLCAQPPLARFTPAVEVTQTNDLFAQLAKAGIIGNGQTVISRPFVELNSQALLISRPELIDLLYDDMPLQCYQCGQRWRDTPDDRTAKDEHLDWHFKTNKRLREHSIRAQSRALYLSETDWITFSIAETKEDATIQAASTQIVSNIPKPSDPALQDLTCPICKEEFITDWDEGTESWIWKNALLAGSTYYHANCYAEATAAQERSKAKDESDDDDIILPGQSKDDPKIERKDSFDLADTLRALSGTLNAMNGIKRKASEEPVGTPERKIKVEE